MPRYPGGECYRLELVACPDDEALAAIRLRAALKCLLRSFRLRCRRVEQLPVGTPPVTPAERSPAEPAPRPALTADRPAAAAVAQKKAGGPGQPGDPPIPRQPGP